MCVTLAFFTYTMLDSPNYFVSQEFAHLITLSGYSKKSSKMIFALSESFLDGMHLAQGGHRREVHDS